MPNYSKELKKINANQLVPEVESAVIEKVAEQYKLTPEQKDLLYVVRKIENGSTGKEFGVLTPQAMRYKDNPDLSFITQAQWAAGTIKKRYNGDVTEFANRWAPVGASNDPNNLNSNWVKNANYYLGLINGE
jgi:hypothetical protein